MSEEDTPVKVSAPFVDPHSIEDHRTELLAKEAGSGTLVMRPAEAQRLERQATVLAEQDARKTQAAGHAAVEAAEAAQTATIAEPIEPNHQLKA